MSTASTAHLTPSLSLHLTPLNTSALSSAPLSSAPLSSGPLSSADLPKVSSPKDSVELPFASAQQERPSLIGESDAMCALKERVERFAQSSSPALVLGETGTGKELCARALHEQSPWREGPFVAINCASIPRELISAELFGCRVGAFTGATSREGLICSAHQGTLFLDEVGELPLEAQAVLLRVLERYEVQPVGSDHTKKVSFRLVCATHRDLPQLVKEGRFRADLYHRLSVLTLEVPPLRARLIDLSFLAFELNPLVAVRLSRAAWKLMGDYAWPGNVRELRNLLLRLEVERPEGLIRGAQLSLLMPPPQQSALEPSSHEPQAREGSFLPSAKLHAPSQLDPSAWLDELTLKEMITRHVVRAVERHQSVSAAARSLEVSRTTVYRYLEYAFEDKAGLEARCEAETSPPGPVAHEPITDELEGELEGELEERARSVA